MPHSSVYVFCLHFLCIERSQRKKQCRVCSILQGVVHYKQNPKRNRLLATRKDEPTKYLYLSFVLKQYYSTNAIFFTIYLSVQLHLLVFISPTSCSITQVGSTDNMFANVPYPPTPWAMHLASAMTRRSTKTG
mmetsp:Transcript_742/g.1658  ORF Transcript_742/g.1658 Transcript_742/m.1658 type:complete len:133 (+) Transcript_742:332-730(+)